MTIYESGAIIANRYEIVQGPHENRGLKGGMGIVYLCIDHGQNKRPVALKTFQSQFLSNRQIRDRFLREGTTWIDVGKHPHIVQAYEVAYTKHGLEVYLVLELVAAADGKRDASLYSWLREGPLPLSQSLLFALHIARGMKHATTKIPNLVHRDLKPSNILVGRDGLARVTDFGLARAMAGDTLIDASIAPGGDEAPFPSSEDSSPAQESEDFSLIQGIEDSFPLQDVPIQGSEDSFPIQGTEGARPRTQLTREGGIVGTPHYIPPEQWLNEELDARADIYAFGCIVQEMVTGQRAAPGGTLRKLKQVHLTGQLRPLPDDTPSEVCTLIQTCLALDKEGRYSNWSEVESAAAYLNITGQQPPAELTPTDVTDADRIATGWSYNEMGLSYLDISKYNPAISYFERVIQIGQAEGERKLEAAGLGNLGIAYNGLGEPQQAMGYHEQNLAIARQIGDLVLEQFALGSLGDTYDELGDPQQAIGYYEQQLAITRQIEDRAREGGALNSLGIAYKNLGAPQQAIGYYNQALAIARQIGDRIREGNALGNLGTAYNQLGDPQQAIHCFNQQLTIARQIGDLASEGRALNSMGTTYLLLGDPQRSINYLNQQLAIADQIGDQAGEERALSNLGIAYFLLGAPQRAIRYYNQALAIAQKIGNVMSVARNSFSIAQSLAQQGHFVKALPYAEYAAQVFTQIGHAQKAQQAQQLVSQIKESMVRK